MAERSWYGVSAHAAWAVFAAAAALATSSGVDSLIVSRWRPVAGSWTDRSRPLPVFQLERKGSSQPGASSFGLGSLTEVATIATRLLPSRQPLPSTFVLRTSRARRQERHAGQCPGRARPDRAPSRHRSSLPRGTGDTART